MAGCKNYDLAEMQAQENQPGLAGKVATHHMKLHYLAASFTQPTLVEFGVAAGRSTCVFIHTAEQTGGHLYSVDIGDFSDVVTSDAWTFIQQSDQNKDAILAAAPAIASGIDLLHIDSKHARSHVEALLMKWYPLVKPGGYITFHDVDPTPYLRGQRKDSPRHELEGVALADVVREFFFANEDDLLLEFHYGSTGMGIMQKLAAMGTAPTPPRRLPSRQNRFSAEGIYWTARHQVRRLVRGE